MKVRVAEAIVETTEWEHTRAISPKIQKPHSLFQYPYFRNPCAD